MNRGSQQQNKQQENPTTDMAGRPRKTGKGDGVAWVMKEKESRNKKSENEEFTCLAAKIVVVARHR